MKILYLTPGCFDKGGISRYCRYQITALRELVGSENVRVLSLLGPDENSFEQSFETTFYSGRVGLGGKVALVREALKYLLRWRPDVVWSAHVNMSGLANVLATLRRVAVIENIYGLEVWSRKRADAAWGLKRSQFVISDCHHTANYAKTHKLISGNLEVVWDCVAIDRFSPGRVMRGVLEKYGIPSPDSGVNILTLGRMVKLGASHKGYERLFEVFRRISDAVPNARLIYAGRGDLVGILRNKAVEKGLSDRVFFTGSVDECDLVDVYRSAHLFSLVSDCGEGRGEGIPLTPLEASACGLPVIVGDQDGSQEAVADGETGFVVDPFDLDQHANRIRYLATNEVERGKMGAKSADRARALFSYTVFREKHRQLLEAWFP